MMTTKILTFCAIAMLSVACGTDPEPERDATLGDTGATDAAEDATADAGEPDVEPPDVVPPSDAPPTDGGMACPGENPAGCTATGCDDGEECFTLYAPESICVSSGCVCDAAAGLWVCDDDCGGGICIPEPGAVPCESDSDCIFGAQWCEEGACVTCSNDSFLCDIDCAHGLVERHGCYPCSCNPAPECDVPPTGCYDDAECTAGEICVPSDTTECIPSSCGCEPETGEVWCTDDCAPGRCQPSACPGENPAGCVDTGCPPGETCEPFVGGVCIPSSCVCDEATASWACDGDCGGGVCMPSDGDE